MNNHVKERIIDLVIPMVFPQDEQWQQVYNQATGEQAPIRGARFRSWGTEELLIRCCMKFMPWLRCIHILLASPSQVQPWMESLTSPTLSAANSNSAIKVKLVFHSDFMPPSALPCFSSPCIEMFLHRIPDLSEYFIYANDDMFPLSPLSQEDFFAVNGDTPSLLPCQNVAEKPYPSSPNLFHKACHSGLNMVAKPFGKKYASTYLRNGHSFAPMLKSCCEEVWSRHGTEIMEHLCPVKRRADSYNQYIYVYYQHLSGLYVRHTPVCQYIVGSKTLEQIVSVIRNPQAGIVCLNDNGSVTDWEKRAPVISKEIAAKLEMYPSSAPADTAPEQSSDTENNSPSSTRPLSCHSANIRQPEPFIDVLVIHYNTPELTQAAIMSLWKHTPNARVTVFDNSDQRQFVTDGLHSGPVNVIDNTHGQIVDWQKWLDTYPDKLPTPENNWGSAKHCYSVEVCMDRFPNGFVLMDSDVLIKQDISCLADPTVAWQGGTQINTKRFGVSIRRIIPFLCWINTPVLAKHGIRYYNGAKMWNMTSREPDCHYDTGAWLLEACNNAGLAGKKIDIKSFVEHYAHGSWRTRKNPQAWLNEHKELWSTELTSHTQQSGDSEPQKVTPPLQSPSGTRYTVLTYIFDGYEMIHEVQEKDPNADYVLVTDNPELKSNTWKIILDTRQGLSVWEKCYEVRFNPFRYAETELCIRIDGSIGINRSLGVIIDKMQQEQYDRCLMLHPRRTTMPSEYEAWIRGRGYNRSQAKRCMEAMRQAGYSMDYHGLAQMCFEVIRRNSINEELNQRTLSWLRNLAEDGRMERVDQTVFSFVLNHYYADRLKVLPVQEHIITDGILMTWYKHNSCIPNHSRQKIAPYLFNRRCIPWRPLLP